MMRDELQVAYNDIPPHEYEPLRALVTNSIVFLPPWLTNLCITYRDTNEDHNPRTVATMDHDYKYRTASMVIYPPYWSQSDRDKDHTMVHEFSHVTIAPLTEYIQTLKTELTEHDASAAGVFNRFMQMMMESVVEDITQILIAQREHYIDRMDELKAEVYKQEDILETLRRPAAVVGPISPAMVGSNDNLSRPSTRGLYEPLQSDS